MRPALDIQTLAATAFLGSFVAAECAARHLAAHPASTLAWQLNLGVFRAFEHARMVFRPSWLLFSPTSLPVAVALLLALAAARATRCRLAVALFANLSFMGSLALLYGVAGEKLRHKAALAPAALAGDAQLPLVATLVVVSLIGCAVSHWSFVRRIAAPGKALPITAPPAGRIRAAFSFAAPRDRLRTSPSVS